MYPVFIAALFTVAKTWEQPKCPSTGDWFKMQCVYIYIYTYICVYIYIYEYYIYNGILVIKKDEILPFAATWMILENIILSEVRERQILYDITFMWNLKSNTN